MRKAIAALAMLAATVGAEANAETLTEEVQKGLIDILYQPGKM